MSVSHSDISPKMCTCTCNAIQIEICEVQYYSLFNTVVLEILWANRLMIVKIQYKA